MEPLGEVLTQLSKGGGAKGINIDDVSRQLEELTRKYPFQVRPSLLTPYLLKVRLVHDRGPCGVG